MSQAGVKYSEWIELIETSLKLACKTTCLETKIGKKIFTRDEFETRTLINLEWLMAVIKSRIGSKVISEELGKHFATFMSTWGGADREKYRKWIDKSFKECKE